MKNEEKLNEELENILSSRLSGEAESLRSTLKETEQAFRSASMEEPADRPASKTVNIRRLIPLLAAACVLVAGTLFFFPGKDADPFYELPNMRSEVVRGDASTADQRYEEAARSYNEGQYARSSELLQALVDEQPEVLQYQYYLGLSLLGEEHYTLAAAWLEPLAEAESVFRDESTYYLAVALYQNEDLDEARRRAEAIPTTSNEYQNAQKLLNKMNDTD